MTVHAAVAGRYRSEARLLEASEQALSWTGLLSGALALAAGALTPFTISIGGLMPVGEFALAAAAGWAVLSWLLNGGAPNALFGTRLFRAYCLAQLVAFASYVVSDLYRHSAAMDIARGWSRMGFLFVDLVGVLFLIGIHRRNFGLLLAGLCLGETASALILGPMFGDMWKFGVGAPLTFTAIAFSGLLGPVAAVLAGIGMGLAHFALDYRNMGGLCVGVSALVVLQAVPAKLRVWSVPVILALAAAGVFVIYSKVGLGSQRANRSDIERSAMLQAAWEGFESSPVLGQGSWFSNSEVYDNFVLIRAVKAKEAHVGGLAGANTDPGDTTLHSQLLVSAAEGGILGASFFLVFGGSLLWALGRIVLASSWRRTTPVVLLFLLSALWNLFFSPFSGAHRVYIAMACGLVLLQLVPREEPDSP